MLSERNPEAELERLRNSQLSEATRPAHPNTCDQLERRGLGLMSVQTLGIFRHGARRCLLIHRLRNGNNIGDGNRTVYPWPSPGGSGTGATRQWPCDGNRTRPPGRVRCEEEVLGHTQLGLTSKTGVPTEHCQHHDGCATGTGHTRSHQD